MKRIPEPELMDSPEQVKAYADEDFSAAHDQLVAGFVERFPGVAPETLLDLGCGAADVTLRFARCFPQTAIVGLDAGSNMLARARLEVAAAGLENQVSLLQAHLPDHALLPKCFDAIVSNSLLHHLSDPSVLWASIKTSGRVGAAVAVMDLLRPEGETKLAELVEMYAASAPPLLKQDFSHSLAAAYDINEIEAQLEIAGLNLSVEAISDRHVLVWGYL